MNKFIKNKSCITSLEGNIRLLINNVMDSADNMIPIMLLTVLNSQSKKNGYSFHGYFMACGIEMTMAIAKISDNKNYYKNKYTAQNVNKITNRLSTLINICLSQNIECVQNTLTKEKSIKIFHNTSRMLNNKLFDVLDDDMIEYSENIKKTDLLKFTFEKIKSPKTLITHIKQANKENLNTFITRKYGSVCQLAIIIGWFLGGGDDKNMVTLEKIGINLGYLIKICYDFENLERDLEYAKETSNNYVINYGIQESFELFIENKLQMVEGCMMLDIYTNTVKEVLDVIESKVDEFINNTAPDLKSHYTISTTSKN